MRAPALRCSLGSIVLQNRMRGIRKERSKPSHQHVNIAVAWARHKVRRTHAATSLNGRIAHFQAVAVWAVLLVFEGIRLARREVFCQIVVVLVFCLCGSRSRIQRIHAFEL